MIASFSRGFIFIKTRKTAGTSLEIFLSAHCAQEDIITPITLEDEKLRIMNGRVAAQNFSGDPKIEAAYRDAVLGNDKAAARRVRDKVRKNGSFYNHMPATQVRENVPQHFWNSAFKFTIERHPYEKVVSLAYFRMAHQSHSTSFEATVETIVQGGDHDNFDLYSDGGTILVDKVFRQESFKEAVAEICGVIGVRNDRALARAKSHHRKDRRPAHDILTEDQKREIRKHSAFSFDVLGYEP